MKKIYFLSTLLVASLSFAQQVPPFYEGFDYTAAGALQTQLGWTALNTGDDLLIGTGSLTYTGIPSSTGNKVTFGGAGIDSSKDFAVQTTGSVYYSFLLNVTDLTAVTSTTGGYSAGFISTGSTFGATFWLKKIDASTFNIGVNPRTTAANAVFGTAAYNINQTYLIVVNYTFNASTADDVVKLWINPVLGGAEPTPDATATNTTGTDLTQIAKFLIRQGSATDTPNEEIDELRIATNWTDATTTTVALGSAKNEISGLSVFPNPVKNGVFYINTNANAERTVTVYDVLGKQVLNTTTSDSAVNVSSLNAGVYMVKITEEGNTATRKLVIE
ncbi:T9SS type A sorting domain-containing protein [Flavobacterium sp. SUN052]|uniref:T9SS type A sorting domain-containing protein n=1 Tax=Flavobacterium sp. SUN052 TaxID=3002441 RepID=UPI00237DDF77|nr:T9SS type A sorting domain-containing protein [Flavobacterium sp. SUN052]MEC4004051.1 T9SS type A sorting domain-containing protein [Flavobacterium sp. SUN052]